MSFGILSLISGNVLDSFRTSQAAVEAVAQIVADEPSAIAHLAVVEFDPSGTPIGVSDGADLVERVRSAALHEVAI